MLNERGWGDVVYLPGGLRGTDECRTGGDSSGKTESSSLHGVPQNQEQSRAFQAEFLTGKSVT